MKLQLKFHGPNTAVFGSESKAPIPLGVPLVVTTDTLRELTAEESALLVRFEMLFNALTKGRLHLTVEEERVNANT
jgi:hypothetical protein